jgi:hypothetical protein
MYIYIYIYTYIYRCNGAGGDVLPGGGPAADSEVPISCSNSNYCVCDAVAAALVSGIGRL